MAAHSVLRMVALLGVSLCSPGNIGREPRDIPHVDRAEPDVVQTGDIVTAFGNTWTGLMSPMCSSVMRTLWR